MSFLTIPTFSQALTENETTSKVWYFFWQGLWKGNPPATESAVTATASPMSYVAQGKGFLIISGGTVSAVSFSRDGTTFYTTGQTSGCFPMSLGDTLRITYSVVPTTLVFVPQ